MRMCFSMRSPFSAFSVFESSNPMILSESRTDDTSGLVTMTAASANRIASVAPRSMPAGLSQITQSNFPRISWMPLPTPSSVNASLSRVCEAGKSHSVSSRLSRMRACGSFAMPWTTLMRSKTTRRSAPITRSRLRSPTSKSTTATFWPVCASAAPSAAVDVVLPTPPLPDVTTRTLAMFAFSCMISIQGCYRQDAVLEPALGSPVAEARVPFFRGPVIAVDRDQLGFVLAAKNPCTPIAHGTRHGPSAQRAVDVDRSTGDDFRARGHRTEHGDVAVGEDDGLARADRTFDQQRGRFLALGRPGRRSRARVLGGCRRCSFKARRGSPAFEQWRQRRAELIRMGALEAHDANAALGQALEQIADSRLAQRNAGQVEDDRSADEKVGRVPAPFVDFGQPRVERRGRREHERHEGAATESHRCLGSNGSRTCHKENLGDRTCGVAPD